VGIILSILFTPIKIGELRLKNRLVMAPMQQFQGTIDANATDYHVEHYKNRAKGELGLIIVESTSIAEDGRLFQNDIGLFTDKHIDSLKKVVDAVHQNDTPIFVQLCHGGRKASPQNKGKMIAPSPIAFNDEYGLPQEMSLDDIKRAIQQFAGASNRAVRAGFDGIELHAAHGYLLHQFLSPLSNQRSDQYGGSLTNRTRILKEVVQAVRVEIGENVPLQIRFSASDYQEEGIQPDDIIEIVKEIQHHGIDAVHISSGGLLPIRPSHVGPGYQVTYAETIKDHLNLPVIAVGQIHTKELAEKVIESKQADLVAIGSPLLEDPNFVKNAMFKMK
jgi:NADPH2 dehydrogenase